MKKKQLKEELELANATLELSMVALRKLDEVLQEAKAQGFVPKNLNNKTKPQAGDKIVESTFKINRSIADESYFVPTAMETMKETPLADLNKEVEIEKQANELIEHFMPLVNGWNIAKASCVSQPIMGNAYWSYNSGDQRKQAIRCAIKHCELMITDKKLAYPDWLQEMNLIYLQLQKMLTQ